MVILGLGTKANRSRSRLVPNGQNNRTGPDFQTLRASEVGQSSSSSVTSSFLTFQWLSKVLEPRLDSFPMPNGRISARFPHLECYLPSPDVSRVGLYKRQNLRPKNLP